MTFLRAAILSQFYFSVLIFYILWNISNCFTNYCKIHNYGINTFTILNKSFK